MNSGKLIISTLVVIALTILTQVGGGIYLLCLFISRPIKKLYHSRLMKSLYRIGVFVLFYLIATFWFVPPVAKLFGRVPLPVSPDESLKPLNNLTRLMNRNYVRPELKKAALNIARKVNAKYPGTVVNYLDAGFPFFNGFPLLPHLSHNDGRKLDMSFLYTDTNDHLPSNDAPSIFGYGIAVEPLAGELNTTALCNQEGYKYYDLLTRMAPNWKSDRFTFDASRTAELVRACTQESSISVVFIEPHLKQRLKLSSTKIRFHGCQAVRHDDHLHIQTR